MHRTICSADQPQSVRFLSGCIPPSVFARALPQAFNRKLVNDIDKFKAAMEARPLARPPLPPVLT